MEQVGGLLRGKISMGGNDGHRVALGHLGEQMQEQSQCGRRYCYRFGLLAIGEELDADTGALAAIVGCKAVAGFAASKASASLGTTVS